MADKIRQITNDEIVQLERMCDDFSLYEVLNKLAHICHEKAEHIEQSIGRAELSASRPLEGEADRWRKRGVQVQATAEYLERMENTRDYTQMHREYAGRLKR